MLYKIILVCIVVVATNDILTKAKLKRECIASIKWTVSECIINNSNKIDSVDLYCKELMLSQLNKCNKE